MPYVKKLVMHGFKSFPSPTEILFENSMNVVVGPNGSGKSNITDAICFVLGRLSIKSMRAAKAANLIFSGTKTKKPAHEASVKIVFDNSDNGFQMNNKEIAIERIVRINGQSIYKLNEEVKTRQEILELLARAGIDPHGFNIVLQGEIASLVRMHAEERRAIIEEVSGISIYETRKEKSLRELEKTDEKLKEVSAVLRERTAYLKNLEEERQQALKFKKLEETVNKCKASLLSKDIEEKSKQLKDLVEELDKKNKLKEKIKKEIERKQSEIFELETKINEINSHIQKSAGVEQEKLHEEITNIKSELAGLSVRKESYENRLEELTRRRNELEKNIKVYEKEIEELKKESPLVAKKQEELSRKRKQFSEIEQERNKLYEIKARLENVREKIQDKKLELEKAKSRGEDILRQIENLSKNLTSDNLEEVKKLISKLKEEIKEKNISLIKIDEENIKLNKELSSNESEIARLEKMKRNLPSSDKCPLCQSQLTEEHINQVIKDTEDIINKLFPLTESINKKIKENLDSKNKARKEIDFLLEKTREKEIDIINLFNINQKKEELRNLVNDQKKFQADIDNLILQRQNIEKNISNLSSIEEKHDKAMLEIEEISTRTDKDIDTAILYKERELENIKNIIKRSKRDEEELDKEIKDMTLEIKEKSGLLEDKEEKEKALVEKFNKLFDEKNKYQKNIQDLNSQAMGIQHVLEKEDDLINNFKIENARIMAEKQSLEEEYLQFKEIEILKESREKLKEKLNSSQETLIRIGNVNLRALEVYDSVKGEYDQVYLKVEQLNKEKEEILKIIQEIDNKKKKTFNKTLEEINKLFTRNFVQLSTKGEATLELENKEEPFSAGLDIIIKIGKGKYFDVTSMSGGEQTLIALSLIFAIQEYKPYPFYIFDEVDAALDKRNSERLANLIKRYMKSGQYIVVTHNDSIITEASTLYGVTMQEGVSKIISLQI